jgi:hypothetical protein
MHRSGTSVASRALKALGVYLGESLLGPGPDNPKGYWEHAEIFALNERVMAALDRPWWSSRPIPPQSWDSRDLVELRERGASLLVELFGGHPLWGFKDPRTIRVFPFWRDVLTSLEVSVSLVLAIRPPASAVSSLVAREGMPVADAEELWLAYMLPWLADIASYPVVVVDYDRLIRSPLRELRRVANHLGVTIDPGDPKITAYTRSFVERALRHHVHRAERSADDAEQATLAEQTYAALLRLTRSGASWRRCLELSRRYEAEIFGRSHQPGPTRAAAGARRRPPRPSGGRFTTKPARAEPRPAAQSSRPACSSPAER